MSLVLLDRVRETTTTTGTGSIVLLGAVTGYKSFSYIGNGNTTYYCISDQKDGSNWEVGIGTWSTGGILSRDSVLSNSIGSTSLIDFALGTKDVFLTYPATKVPTAMPQEVAQAGTSTTDQTISAAVLNSVLPTAMSRATAQAGTSTTTQTISATVLDSAVEYGAFTPAYTGAVSRTVQSKLQDVVSVFDFMTANQIADVKAGTLLIDVTDAINTAIAVNKALYFPEGSYLHTGILITSAIVNFTTLTGAGKNRTKLVCLTAGKDNLTITSPLTSTNANYFASNMTIRDMSFYGNNLTGRGIVLDTVCWYTIEDVYILGMGSHGIEILCSTGLPINGSFTGSITKTKTQNCGGDGFRQIARSGSGQQNATWISNCEFQSSKGNGVTLWGTNLTVQNNVIEGNIGYGVQLDNKNTTGNIYSATSINISDNYFETNSAGHINCTVSAGGNVGSGVVVGLIVEGNYGYSIVNTIPFSVTNTGSTENTIRDFRYASNNFGYMGAGYTIEADFANALNVSSQVNPYWNYNSSSVAIYNQASLETKFIGLGYCKFAGLINYTCNGFLTAKGGNNLSYPSDLFRSGNVTVSPANTYFPLDIPMNSKIERLGIAIDTDSASYKVRLRVKGAKYDYIGPGIAPISIFESIETTLSGSTYMISESSLSHSTSCGRITSNNANLMLEVVVTITTTGTYFYLGNPTIYYA